MFSLTHLVGFGGWTAVCLAVGYFVCHRGLSKAVADAKQALADAKGAVSSATKT